jgi:hypothetical protein
VRDDPADAAVWLHQAIFGRERLSSLNGLYDLSLNAFAVGLVNTAKEFCDRSANLCEFRIDVVEGGEPCVGDDTIGLDIPIPGANAVAGG